MRTVPLLCLVLLSAACGRSGAAPADDVARAAPAVSALEAALPPLRQPRPGLFTAGQPSAQAWPALRQRGIGTVINLRPAGELAGRDEAAEVGALGLDYLALPVAGAADVTAANADALWTRLQQAHGPVLVHCASGNRVGALLAIGAARGGGMTPEQALAFGREAGLTSLEPRVREVLGLDADQGTR